MATRCNFEGSILGRIDRSIPDGTVNRSQLDKICLSVCAFQILNFTTYGDKEADQVLCAEENPSCMHWCGVVDRVPPKTKISSSEIDVELCSVRGGGMLELGSKSTIFHLRKGDRGKCTGLVQGSQS